MENKTLDQSIQDTIQKSLSEGIIEKVITEKLEECISKSLRDIFEWHGPVKKAIENKISESMVTEIEKYNFASYTAKLEPILEELLKESTLSNKEVLKNFKKVLISAPEEISISDIFDEYCENIENIDTFELDEYDEYNGSNVVCYMDIVSEEDRFSISESRYIIFGTKTTSGRIINPATYKIRLWERDEKIYIRSIVDSVDFFSLSSVDEFTLSLMKYKKKYTNIILDEQFLSSEVHISGEYESD